MARTTQPNAASRHLVLVGLMGSGKSTVGRLLAQRLGRPFSDSDQVIADRLATTASAIATQSGLDALHRIEADALLEALDSGSASVIAAAASVVDDGGVRSRLASALVDVVWLRAPASVLAGRATRSSHRPLGGDPAGLLAQQQQLRAARFEEVADLVVDTSDRSPSSVVDAVLRWLGRDGSEVAERRS